MNPSPLLLVWTAVVLVAYLGPVRFDPATVFVGWTTHGLPVGPELVDALAGHARHLLAAIAVAAAAWSAGRGSVRLARARGWHVALPAGVLVLGTLGLGLGLTGLIRSGVPNAVVGTLLIVAAVRGRRSISGMPAGLLRFLAGLTALEWFAGLVGAATCLAVLPSALAPEITYDALAVHLGAPLEYLKAGRVVRLEHLMHADLPSVLQMDYLFAIALGGPGAGRLVHFLLGIAGMAFAGRLARRVGGASAAGAAVAIMAATPFVATLMLRANVDLGVMLLVAAAADRLVVRDLFLAGLFAGGAAAVKPTGGFALVAVAAIAGRPSARIPAGAMMALGAWAARSWLFTGNPAYPFLHGILGGLGWSGENAATLRRDVQGENYGNVVYAGALAKLAAPWLIVMKDRVADAALGPSALVLLPALLFRPSRVPRLPAFAGLFSLCWVLTSRDPRFLLPVWPVAAALSAVAFGELVGWSGASIRAVLLSVMAATPLFIAAKSAELFNPGPVLWGAITPLRYAEVLLPPANRAVPLAREAGRGSFGGRVLVTGGVKAAWVSPRALYQSMADTPHLIGWTRESPTADRLAVRFRQAGVGRMIYDAGAVAYLHAQFGAYALSSRERAVLATFWVSRLVPLRWFREPPVMLLYGVTRVPVPPTGPPLPGWPD